MKRATAPFRRTRNSENCSKLDPSPMTGPPLPLQTLLGYDQWVSEEDAGHPSPDLGRGQSGQPGQHRCQVALHHPDELAEFIVRQFVPRASPTHAEAEVGELLWTFLETMRARLDTPEQWRSRRLLLPAEQAVAETLSSRLQGGALLPRQFAVWTAGPLPRPFWRRPTLRGPWGRLFSPFARPALAPAPEPSPSSAATPLATLLESAPAVQALRRTLLHNQRQADLSTDPHWRYHARAALEDYLPETLRLHAERGGQPDDPELLAALEDIRRIALPQDRAADLRWEAQRRFLTAKAAARGVEEEG